MNTGTASRRNVVQVVATGTFGSQGDLRTVLDASDSGVDVAVWMPDVRDILPHVASGDVEAVLIGAPADLGHMGRRWRRTSRRSAVTPASR